MVELFIMIVTIYLVWDVANDRHQIGRMTRKEKGREAALRGLFLILGAYGLYGVTWTGLAFLVMVCSWYWLVFDWVMNIMLGKPLIWKGSTAFTDRVFGNASTQLAVKIIVVIASAIVYSRLIDVY